MRHSNRFRNQTTNHEWDSFIRNLDPDSIMSQLSIGDEVTFNGCDYKIHGLSDYAIILIDDDGVNESRLCKLTISQVEEIFKNSLTVKLNLLDV